ncbi:MAG: hypothetical protein JNL11_10920 [Bdellovibrionaceae bacterium]|nr:hypothetical protein [Pseudobdellovibrionaceae bacterium]
MLHFFRLQNLFSLVILATTCLVTSPAMTADNMIIINGKPFNFQPMDIPTCGEVNSSQQAAAMFALNFTQSNGESAWISACKAGVQTKCTSDDIKKFGIQMIFDLVRKYESGLSNAACKLIRKECEDRCVASKFFDERACLIECNQYETWKR